MIPNIIDLGEFLIDNYEDAEDDFSYLETDGNLDLDHLITQKLDISSNPLFHKDEDQVKQFCKIIRDPDYLPFTCEHVFNLELLPTYHILLKEIYTRTFPMLIGSRGLGKSFNLALYIMWRLLVNQGIKVAVVGAAFRQSKLIFNYCLSILENAPVYQSMCGNGSKIKILKGNDKCTIQIGESVATFLPLGDGETIRGERANIIIADEFSMIPVDVYETVVKGFTAVSQNPIKTAKQLAKMTRKKKKGLWSKEQENLFRAMMKSNQSIVSGTAYYSFNAFCDYWKKYKKIIETKNLKDVVSEEDTYANCNRNDFAILRIPYEIVPDGFLDKKNLAQTRSMIAESTFQMEYNAVFPEDSNGFFSRRIIESCVVKREREIGHEIVQPFTASIMGVDSPLFYVMGVDPASSEDNFSIVVISVYETYRKVVYCWTIQKSKLAQRIKDGVVEQQDYYGYCAKKIRQVMKAFSPCEIIALDAQGGGEAGVAEALADKDKYAANELPIFPLTKHHPFWDKKDRHTDNLTGQHIVELVQFARADYLSEANHGLKKDMVDGILLFPFFDPVALNTAVYHDDEEGLEYDNLELCMLEIEELKDELATIQHTQTPKTNRDHWDTPEVKLADNKKGRLRKDRYSALLIANMAARRLQRMPDRIRYVDAGGFAHQKISTIKKSESGNLYAGPSRIANQLNICAAVRRGR